MKHSPQTACLAHRTDMAALDGVRVLDLSRVLAGPLCTQMLADHGADVVKVEPPAGDETRTFGPPFDAQGDAAYFSAINRGKRALSLDLGKPEGQAVLLRLLEDADVLVENFLPGTMERWGVGYDTLASRFPRLVYASISGFGAEGPLGGLPGYDAVLQAMCGLMSVNGRTRRGRLRVGIPVVDHLTGYVALTGILMALYARDRTGAGQRVEASLFDTGLSLLVPHAANWFRSGRAPQLLGSAHPEHLSLRQVSRARRRAVPRGRQRQSVPQAVRAPRALRPGADARFADNGHRVAATARHCGRSSSSTLRAARRRARCAANSCARAMPAGPVNTVPQAFAQAHAVASRLGGRGRRLPRRRLAGQAVQGNAGVDAARSEHGARSARCREHAERRAARGRDTRQRRELRNCAARGVVGERPPQRHIGR